MQDSLSFFRITRFDEVSSTNDLVKQRIDEGAAEGEVICARLQTAGYGRQGRVWKSPEGGLYMSVLLRPNVPFMQLPTLSLVVGVAVRRAIAKLAQPAASNNVLVKWPNDVVLCAQRGNSSDAFHKLCGISSEQHNGGICVGIGVNVFKPALADDTGGAAGVGDADSADSADGAGGAGGLGDSAGTGGTAGAGNVGGKNVAAYVFDIYGGNALSINLVCETILQSLADCYAEWAQFGFAAFAEEYNAYSALNGREVRIERADGSLIADGIVCSTDSTGALIVKNSKGEENRVLSGEAHIAF